MSLWERVAAAYSRIAPKQVEDEGFGIWLAPDGSLYACGDHEEGVRDVHPEPSSEVDYIRLAFAEGGIRLDAGGGVAFVCYGPATPTAAQSATLRALRYVLPFGRIEEVAS
jgi:hypothetical protein